MNNKTLTVVLIILIVFVGGFVAWYLMQNDDTTTTTNTANTVVSTISNRERPPANTVWIIDGNFSPSVITVSVGDIVTWVNQDDLNRQISSMATTNTNAGELFKSEELATDDSYSYTFDTAGTWSYFDVLNPIKSGQIVVE